MKNSKHQTTNGRERHDNETAPSQRKNIELDVEVLEERIAPFYWGGSTSWFSRYLSFSADGISINRCETLVGEGN